MTYVCMNTLGKWPGVVSRLSWYMLDSKGVMRSVPTSLIMVHVVSKMW